MVSSTGGRAGIQAELTALAESHIAKFDTYTDIINDPAKGHFAKYTLHTDGSNRVTVAKYHAKGLTLDKIKAYYADLPANASKLNKNKVTALGEVDGYPIIHTVTELSWPMSNRSVVAALYKKEEGGVFTIVSSSKGNEALVTEHAKAIGKNVVANLII